jgi:hypothetical protein
MFLFAGADGVSVATTTGASVDTGACVAAAAGVEVTLVAPHAFSNRLLMITQVRKNNERGLLNIVSPLKNLFVMRGIIARFACDVKVFA